MLKLMWSGVAAGDFSATQIRAGVDQNILADYLFRNQKLPDGWGFGMTFQSGAGIRVRAEAPIGVTTGVGPDDGTLWKIAVSMGAVSFGFGLGHQKAKHGFNFHLRPQAVIPKSRLDTAEKTLALAWDHKERQTPQLQLSRNLNRSGFDAASFCEKDADHVQALPSRAA